MVLVKHKITGKTRTISDEFWLQIKNCRLRYKLENGELFYNDGYWEDVNLSCKHMLCTMDICSDGTRRRQIGDECCACPKHNCITRTRELWTEEKTNWCCKNKQLGCSPPDFTYLGPSGDPAPTPSTSSSKFNRLLKYISKDVTPKDYIGTGEYGFILHQYTPLVNFSGPTVGSPLTLREFLQKSYIDMSNSDKQINSSNYFFGQAGPKSAPLVGLMRSYTFWSYDLAKIFNSKTVSEFSFQGGENPIFYIQDPKQLVDVVSKIDNTLEVFPELSKNTCVYKYPSKDCLFPARRCMYPFDAGSNGWCEPSETVKDCKWCPDRNINGIKFHPAKSFDDYYSQITSNPSLYSEDNETLATEYDPGKWTKIDSNLGNITTKISSKENYPVLAFGMFFTTNPGGPTFILWLLLIWIELNKNRKEKIPLIGITDAIANSKLLSILDNDINNLFIMYPGECPLKNDINTWNSDLISWVEQFYTNKSKGWLLEEYNLWFKK